MTDFIPQPYPLFLAVNVTERRNEVQQVVAWRVSDDQDDDAPDLLPVTLLGPRTPGASVEPDRAANLYAYGDTADAARAALAALVDQHGKGTTR